MAGHDTHDHHSHGHSHGHHSHGHHHDEAFDWDAMADRLVLDAAIVMPMVAQVLSTVPEVHEARTVLDVGCGPGAIACALAQQLPHATVTAMDTSDALLRRADAAAAAAGVHERVRTVVGDLEGDLSTLPTADLVWAGMVLHHVADPVATLRRLHGALRPGGTLVMIEFGRPPQLQSADLPAVTAGAWHRLQTATSAVLQQRLGLDPVTVDWPAHLQAAGFTDVTDTELTATHAAPLSPDARAWFDAHVRRGIEMAGDRIGADDVGVLLALADDVAADDARTGVVAHRRVVLARRP